MLKPFRPTRARTPEQARAVGRAWAEHEASDPESLKGKPADGSAFFYVFEEAAAYVDAADTDAQWALVEILGAAACARWRELAEADDLSLAWERTR